MKEKHCDVIVIGGGPAGAVAAAIIARSYRVLLVERHDGLVPRIGESLVPASRQLLADLGVLEAVLSDGHLPYNGNVSVWGDSTPDRHDFLFDIAGSGLHLDRPKFEKRLRDQAVAGGAHLLQPATVSKVEAICDEGSYNFLTNLDTRDGDCLVKTRFIVDATGRSSHFARRMGAKRRVYDNLTSIYTSVGVPAQASQAPDSFTYIEAVEEGWWYSTHLPSGKRLFAFHTDGDLSGIRQVRTPTLFLRHLNNTQLMTKLFSELGDALDEDIHVSAANSSALNLACGDNWLAVGDAAIAFDPLSSQGILNALFTGLTGGKAVLQVLRGQCIGLTEYDATIKGVYQAYLGNLAKYYALEQRWPNSVFWQRRAADLTAHSA